MHLVFLPFPQPVGEPFLWYLQRISMADTECVEDAKYICFVLLHCLKFISQFRWIVLDFLTVLAANLLHYYICWSNKYKTLVLVTFSCCSRSSLCRSSVSFVHALLHLKVCLDTLNFSFHLWQRVGGYPRKTGKTSCLTGSLNIQC